MSRLRDRSPSGQRCLSGIAQVHWTTITFTGALRLSNIAPPMVLDGPMNGAVFRANVGQVLIPPLILEDIVIMANSSAHKADGMQTKLPDVRCVPFRLTAPTSIPSRKLSQSSKHTGLDERTDIGGEVITTYKPQQCTNYFADCGYEPDQNGHALVCQHNLSPKCIFKYTRRMNF